MAALLRGWRLPLLLALVPVTVLMLLAERYGFHRDEFYFVEAGRHPAWSYPDQPPLVPLLATAWYDLVRGSLPAFRLVPALLTGVVTAIGWATSRELGGDRLAAAVTAVVVGTASTLLAAGHLFGTTVADIALSSAIVLLLLRAVRTDGMGAWLALGAVTAVAVTVKTLPVFLLACCAVALLVSGHARLLRRPGPWAASALALLGAAGPLWWQATNGWPQAALGAAIAAGSSGTSVDRWLLVPLLATLTGPLTTPFWVAGAWSLARDPEHAGRRWLPLGALAFVIFVVVSGGKPYYVMAVVPALSAAGVPVVLRWAQRRRWRAPAVSAAVVLNAVVGAVLVLPILPARLAPLDVNYDLGERVGWPRIVATVSAEAAKAPTAAVITVNYGEAGALDAARRDGVALPPVHSGHNGYWWWGPPTGPVGEVLLVGFPDVTGLPFVRCRQVAVLDTGGLDNDEAGRPVHRCDGPSGPWVEIWPELQRLG